MLAKRIIPCLDIKDGRVVKGVNFINLKDAGDPLELAIKYNQEGADELVFLDITATNEKRKTVLELAAKLARKIFIPFTIGGGISSLSHIEDIILAGADKISINSAAIKNPQLITEGAKKFGSQCIVIAVDVKKIANNQWHVFSHAGQKDTGLDAIEWTKQVEDYGAGEILLTSMDTDGSKTGFDLEITHKISSQVSIPVIASGGGGTLQHFVDVIEKGKADAALAASIFHYSQFSITDVKEYMKQHQIPIRL